MPIASCTGRTFVPQLVTSFRNSAITFPNDENKLSIVTATVVTMPTTNQPLYGLGFMQLILFLHQPKALVLPRLVRLYSIKTTLCQSSNGAFDQHYH